MCIRDSLDGAVDLDDVVSRSVRVLSQLTRQVAMVQYPTLSRSTVRHIELVALAPNRLLAVLILSTGRVEQRVVEVSTDLTDMALGELRSRLNAAAAGELIADAVAALRRERSSPRATSVRSVLTSTTRCSTRPVLRIITTRTRLGASATTSMWRTVERDSVGYCTIAT